MEERVHNGVTYRRSGPGEPWQRVGAPAPQGGTYIPPSARTERKKGAEADKAVLDVQQGAATLPYAAPQAQANVTGTELDNEAKRIANMEGRFGKLQPGYRWKPDGTGAERIPGLAVDAETAGAGQKLANLRTLQAQIARVRELHASTLKGGMPNWFNRFVPDFANEELGRFDSAGAGLGEVGLAAFRVPGSGSQSDTELLKFIAANEPQSTDSDAKIEEKLRTVETRLNNTLQGLGVDPATAAAASSREAVMPGAMGAPPPSSGGMPPAPPQAPAPTAPQTEIRADGSLQIDPALAGVNARVNQMLTRGASEAEIRAYLNSVRHGMGNQASGIAENVEYIRRNPGYTPQVDVEQVWTPAGGVSEFIGNIANNPVGAGIISAGNAATFGNLANLAGGDASLVMEGMREQNPVASFTGDILGSGLAMGGLAGGATRLGANALTRAGGLGADLLYGGVRGASETEGGLGDKAAGGLFGLGAAGLGNVAGRGITGGLGRATRGVSDPAVRTLNERGIAMTPGQIIGQSGFLGRNLGRLENAIESVPFIGGNIRARREQGIGDYGRAQLQENLAPIGYTPPAGQSGVDMIGDAQQAMGNAYGFLDNRTFAPDQQVVNEIAQALGAGRAVPRTGEEFGAIMDRNIGPLFDQGGNITGRGFQDALQTLRGARSDFAQEGAMGNMAGDAVSDVEAALMGMVQRQAPDVTEDLARANQAYAGLVPIENASIGAINERNVSGQFTPAQYGRAAVNNTRKFGGRGAAARGDIPGGELQRAAQQVLPSEVPNSGTADRAMAAMLLPAALGGGGVAASQYTDDPTLAIILGLLAAGTTRTGQQAAQRALVSRPDALRQAGEQVYQLRGLGGRAGSALGAGSIPWLLANE